MVMFTVRTESDSKPGVASLSISPHLSSCPPSDYTTISRKASSLNKRSTSALKRTGGVSGLVGVEESAPSSKKSKGKKK